MAEEPENLVLQILRGMREEMADMKAELKQDIGDVKAELKAEFKAGINSLRADVASDLLTMQAKTDSGLKANRDQIVGLRRAVVEYHSAVIGHGFLISELEERMRRVEQHLDLPAPDSH